MDCRCPMLTLLAVTLLAAPLAHAGDEAPAGPRLRVTAAAAPSGSVTGTLVGLDEAALTLRISDHDRELRLARDSVTRIEISRRRGNRGKAVLLGLVAGAVVGAVVGAASAESDDMFSSGEAAGVVAVVFAPAGALIGLAFLGIAPARGGGAGVRVVLSF